MLLVYIASPLTLGGQEYNVARQTEAANRLLNYGYVPLAPLVMGDAMERMQTRTWEEWMEACYEWLYRCDAVLRLEGASKGADMEVSEATRMGIPVFYSIEQLANAMRG